MSAISRTFEPLTCADFAQLEELGSTKRRRIAFSPELREALNASLKRHCGVHGEKLIREEQRGASRALAAIHNDATRLLKKLRELPKVPGGRLAIWQLLPSDRQRLFGDELTLAALLQSRTGAELAHAVEEIARLSQLGTADFSPQVGRPNDYWIKLLVYLFAEAFEAAGGRASSGWEQAAQVVSGRDSAFLRALRFLHSRLPAARRAHSVHSLAERAKEVLVSRNAEPGRKHRSAKPNYRP